MGATRMLAVILLVASLAIAACSGVRADGPGAVDEARATEIAAQALEAFNAGDYDGWSRDWSNAMKEAIGVDAFLAWRAAAMEQLGRYVSLGAATRTSRTPGTYRWTFTVRFEKGEAPLGFAFAGDGQQVEGVFAE
jgi:hypothetical protein